MGRPGPADDEAWGERELARAALAGEPGALDLWLAREHPAVHRLCFGLLADAAEADDAAQDAMLRLLDRLPRYDPTRPWRPWRDALVVNLCRDRLRRRTARRHAEEEAARLRPEAARPDPTGPLARDEVRRTLAAALGALSPRVREAFVLRDLEERPTADVAAALGVAEATVRSLVALARRRLRGLLAAHVPGEP